jgi:hypothetical protein
MKGFYHFLPFMNPGNSPRFLQVWAVAFAVLLWHFSVNISRCLAIASDTDGGIGGCSKGWGE